MNFLLAGPPYFDAQAATVVQGLNLCGHKVYGYNSDSRNYLEPYSGQQIDIFIYAPLANMSDIDISLPIPKILLWIHDNGDFGPFDCSRYYYDLAFIRDYYGQCESKTYPINFGIEQRYYEFTGNKLLLLKERPIDVVFQGNMDQWGRPQFLTALLETFDEYNLHIGNSAKQEPNPYWSTWVNGRTQHWSDYYRLLAKSKIILSLHGCGPDSYRTWEGFASGGIPVVQKYPSILVEPQMQDGINCITFEKSEDMIIKIRYLLEHLEESQNIADNAFEFGKKYHTTKARGDYMLKIMKQEGLI